LWVMKLAVSRCGCVASRRCDGQSRCDTQPWPVTRASHAQPSCWITSTPDVNYFVYNGLGQIVSSIFRLCCCVAPQLGFWGLRPSPWCPRVVLRYLKPSYGREPHDRQPCRLYCLLWLWSYSGIAPAAGCTSWGSGLCGGFMCAGGGVRPVCH